MRRTSPNRTPRAYYERTITVKRPIGIPYEDGTAVVDGQGKLEEAT